MSKPEKIDPLLFGGDIETSKKKQRKKFKITPQKLIPESMLSVLANSELNHEIFGIIEELQPKTNYAFENQSKSLHNRLFLLYNNIIQRNFYDHEMDSIDLKPFISSLTREKIEIENNFEGACTVLKELAKAFLSVEDKNDDEEEQSEDEESQKSENPEQRNLKEFKKLNQKGVKLNGILRSIPIGKLTKFLQLVVNNSNPFQKTIEDMRYILHLCLDIPVEAVKFKEKELIYLYLGLPFAAIVNEKRVQFLKRFKTSDNEEEDEANESDEDSENEDGDDSEKEEGSEKAKEEEETEENGEKNDNKKEEELTAEQVRDKLREWINELISLFSSLRNKDLDNIKPTTYDKEHKEIRSFECPKLKWLYAPCGQSYDVTLIKMKDDCEVSTMTFSITIVRDDIMFQFENVTLSNYNTSNFLTYLGLKDQLNNLLTIPNDNYIVARHFSTKSAIFQKQRDFINQEFTNDVICYYNINSNELAEIENGTKDLLFIRITDTYLFVLVFELRKSMNEQLDIILNKFKKHNINFSAEELQQKLLWDDNNISWDNKFSYFVERKDKSKLGETGVMFTFNGSESDKPIYKNERYPHTVNLKMDLSSLISYYYKLNMENYMKQNFDHVCMIPSIFGFEIGAFSSKYDFCKKFDIMLKDFDEDKEDTRRSYRVFAVLLKKPTRSSNSLFLYNPTTVKFESLESDEAINFEDMKSKYVTMVYFVREESDRGEDRMEMVGD